MLIDSRRWEALGLANSDHAAKENLLNGSVLAVLSAPFEFGYTLCLLFKRQEGKSRW